MNKEKIYFLKRDSHKWNWVKTNLYNQWELVCKICNINFADFANENINCDDNIIREIIE